MLTHLEKLETQDTDFESLFGFIKLTGAVYDLTSLGNGWIQLKIIHSPRQIANILLVGKVFTFSPEGQLAGIIK